MKLRFARQDAGVLSYRRKQVVLIVTHLPRLESAT